MMSFESILKQVDGQEKEKQNLVFTILDNINRPQYGIANIINDAVDGGNFTPLKSFWDGLALNEKKSIGDALTEIGWEPESKVGKVAKGIVGFAGDVLTDPLTYTGIGLATKGGALIKGGTTASRAIKAKRALGLATEAKSAFTFGAFGKRLSIKSNTLDNAMKALSRGKYSIRQNKKVAPVLDKVADIFSTKMRPSSIDPIKWNKWLDIKEAVMNTAKKTNIDIDKLNLNMKKRIIGLGLDDKTQAEILQGLETQISKVKKAPLIKLGGELTNDEYIDRLLKNKANITGKEVKDKYIHLIDVLGRNTKKEVKSDKIGEIYNYFIDKIKGLKNIKLRAFDNEADYEKYIRETYKGLSEKKIQEKISKMAAFNSDNKEIRIIVNDLNKLDDREAGVLLHEIKHADEFLLGKKGKGNIKDIADDAMFSKDEFKKMFSTHHAEGFFEVNEIQRSLKPKAKIKIKQPMLEQAVKKEIDSIKVNTPKDYVISDDTLTEFYKKFTKDLAPKITGQRYATKIRDMLSKEYKATFGKDLDTDTYKHLTHILAGKSGKPMAKEFIDADIGRHLKGIKRENGIIGLPEVKGDIVVNLKSGNLFANGKRFKKFKLGDDQVRALVESEKFLYDLPATTINKTTGVKIFSTDIADVLTAQAKAVQRVAVPDQLIKSAVKGLGKQFDIIPTKKEADGYVRMSGEIIKAIPEMNNKYVPKTIAKELNKVYDLFAKPESKNEFVKLFDKVQNEWKGIATFMNPSFHIRNSVSNVYQNSLAGVNNPADYKEALKLEKLYHTNPSALIIAQRKLYKEYQEQGLSTVGRATGDIEREVTLKNLHGVFDTLLKPHRAIKKKGAAIGQGIENNAKLAHFIAKRKEGLSALEAGRSVKKYLFDYQDLTDIERKYFKRVLPFYTWTRKNVPLQLESLVKTPTVPLRVLKAKNNIEILAGDEETRKTLPDWLKDAAPIYIGKSSSGKARYVKLEGLVPVADIAKLKPDNAISSMLEMLSPVLKTPVEQFLNYNFFFGTRITGQTKAGLGNNLLAGFGIAGLGGVGERDFLNSRIGGRLDHLARLYRPISEIEKLFGRKYIGKDNSEKIGRFTIGSVIYSEDPKVLLKKFNRLSKSEESNIIRQINYLRDQVKKEPKRRKQNHKDIVTLRTLLSKARIKSRQERIAAR